MQKKPSQTTMSLYEKKYNHLIKKIGFDDQKLLNELKLFNPDFVINCFCNFKFEKILKNFETYNVHLSFLPQYRGRHPLHWAIINGEIEHGITIHRMNEKFDCGEIIWQKKVEIKFEDSAKTLRKRLMNKLKSNIDKIVELMIYKNYPIIKNNSQRLKYARRRLPKDNQIKNFTSYNTVHNFIRSLSDDDNLAFVEINDNLYYLRKVEIFEKNNQIKNLSKKFIIKEDEIYTVCDDGTPIKLLINKKKYKSNRI